MIIFPTKMRLFYPLERLSDSFRSIYVKRSRVVFFKKMGQPRPLFRLFLVFSNKHHYNFTTNICEKMSIQYTGPGFEPTTFGTRVSSHYH